MNSASTRWQFYGGIRTIGGTIISVEHGRYRLIFDLGKKFNPQVPVFDDRIQARGIKDLVRLGMAPELPGLFDESPSSSGKEDVETLVFISHSHLDHTGLLPYLRPDIPVILSVHTHELLAALDGASMGPGAPLSYRPTPFEETVSFGPFQLTLKEVDHDTPGASALFIEAPDIRIVYSGDLRLHGSHPEKTLSFVERAKEFQPDVLFIEGTRTFPENGAGVLAETELLDSYTRAMEEADAGVYFTYYPHNAARLGALHEAAKKSNRQLAARVSSLYVAAQMGESIEGIAVFDGDRERWSADCVRLVEERQIPTVGLADVRLHAEDYALELPYDCFVELVDIEPQQGSVYIHSNGEPLGAFDPHWVNFQFWLETFGLKLFSVGTPGHASKADILSIIETIAPRTLMPIHSAHPELIGLTSVPRVMPAYNQTYTRDDVDNAKPPTSDELELPRELSSIT